jgi:hypothetical protein
MTSAGAARPKPPRYTSAGVTAGLYLPSFVHGYATHELTRKIRRSKVSREHDPEFAELLAVAATRHFPEFQPDLVVSVPERPGAEDRFRSIRTELASWLGRRTPARCSGRGGSLRTTDR